MLPFWRMGDRNCLSLEKAGCCKRRTGFIMGGDSRFSLDTLHQFILFHGDGHMFTSQTSVTEMITGRFGRMAHCSLSFKTQDQLVCKVVLLKVRAMSGSFIYVSTNKLCAENYCNFLPSFGYPETLIVS
jgi:hypothetical protein